MEKRNNIMSIALYGVPISGGFAIGRAHLLQQSMDDVPHYEISEEDIESEIKRFENAIKETRRQLEQLRTNIPENAPTELGAFISLHLMLLNDANIVRDPTELIKKQKINAEWALRLQTDKLSEQFDSIEDAYLHERKNDMLQVVERVFKNLRGQDTDPSSLQNDIFDDDTILIAADLSPADTMFFKNNRIVAFVTDLGGQTSHTAILGRGMDIPSVISLNHALRLVHEDELVIVDGIDGVLIVQPDEFLIKEYRKRAREYRAHQRDLSKLRNTAAMTQDGVAVEILANISSPDDMVAVNKNASDGVGLYRSEFLFMNRDTLPDEEEQYQVYSKIIKKAAGKPVVIRTMDLGADKNPRWFGQVDCPNPALGLTGIRLSLAEPVLFRTQMCAILRAGVHGPVQILWPMISSAFEVRQCLSHLRIAKESLIERNVDFAENIETGIMVETPAAALTINALLKYIDFISIGTNDLIQYTLAVDRGDKAVADFYQPTHPAIIKLLRHIYKAAQRMNKSVSICGEMAGDATFTRLLLGIGFRRLSMQTANMLAVKEAILSSNIEKLETQILPLLKNDDSERSLELVKKLNIRDEITPESQKESLPTLPEKK